MIILGLCLGLGTLRRSNTTPILWPRHVAENVLSSYMCPVPQPQGGFCVLSDHSCKDKFPRPLSCEVLSCVCDKPAQKPLFFPLRVAFSLALYLSMTVLGLTSKVFECKDRRLQIIDKFKSMEENLGNITFKSEKGNSL